ncbi:MAG: hypothetical protein AB7L18_15205, partial [Hyphomicrobiaceae bacterium]
MPATTAAIFEHAFHRAAHGPGATHLKTGNAMRSYVLKSRAKNARNELVMLLLASMAAVAVLTVAMTRSLLPATPALGVEKTLLIAMVALAALLASGFVWRSVTVARHLSRRARDEAAELRRSLATAEAIIKAEPQILLFWDQNDDVQMVAQSLHVEGMPHDKEDILCFGQWLDARSTAAVKANLDTLFREGKSFNIILRTKSSDHVEADGRATGGRAVLRLRDVTGYKRDLARIIDQHQWLARDIRSMRALLNALPMPVWLKTRDGRLTWVNHAYVKAVEMSDEDDVLTRQIELLDTRERQRALRAL